MILLALNSYAAEEPMEVPPIKGATISLVEYIKSQNKSGQQSKDRKQNGLGIIGKENRTSSLGLLRRASSSLKRSVSSSASDLVWPVADEPRESTSLEHMAQLAGYEPTEKYLDQQIVEAIMHQMNAKEAFQEIIDRRLLEINSPSAFEQSEICDAKDLYYKSIFDLNHWMMKHRPEFDFNTSYVRFGEVSELILNCIQVRKDQLKKAI